jgi:hypothetical protein
MAPEEPQTIPLAPANMSMCELRSEIARCFEVPPEQQRLVLNGEGQAQVDPGADSEGSGGGDGGLVGEGSDPSAMVWGSGVRAGMRLLLVAADSPAAVDEEMWSVERVVGLQREKLESEVAGVKRRVEAVSDVVGFVATFVGIVGGGTIGCAGFAGFAGCAGAIGCVVGDVVFIVIGAAVAVGAVVIGASVGVDFTVGSVVGGVGGVENFAAALEGRDYIPLPRTRGWGTTVAPQLGTPVNQ